MAAYKLSVDGPLTILKSTSIHMIQRSIKTVFEFLSIRTCDHALSVLDGPFFSGVAVC